MVINKHLYFNPTLSHGSMKLQWWIEIDRCEKWASHKPNKMSIDIKNYWFEMESFWWNKWKNCYAEDFELWISEFLRSEVLCWFEHKSRAKSNCDLFLEMHWSFMQNLIQVLHSCSNDTPPHTMSKSLHKLNEVVLWPYTDSSQRAWWIAFFFNSPWLTQSVLICLRHPGKSGISQIKLFILSSEKQEYQTQFHILQTGKRPRECVSNELQPSRHMLEGAWLYAAGMKHNPFS